MDGNRELITAHSKDLPLVVMVDSNIDHLLRRKKVYKYKQSLLNFIAALDLVDIAAGPSLRRQGQDAPSDLWTFLRPGEEGHIDHIYVSQSIVVKPSSYEVWSETFDTQNPPESPDHAPSTVVIQAPVTAKAQARKRRVAPYDRRAVACPTRAQ